MDLRLPGRSAARVALVGGLAFSAALGAAMPTGGRAQSCATERPAPARVVSSTHAVPRGAGIVLDVGTIPLDDVRLVGPGERPHRLDVEPVTDRLAVLRVPATLAPGEYDLRGVTLSPGRDRPLEVTDAAVPAPPPVPRLASLRRREHHDTGSPDHSDMVEIALEATLRGDAPDGVVALVARWTDDEGEHATWGAVSSTPIVLATLRPCASRGEVAERRTRVRLFYVDGFGQRSVETSARRVR